MFKFLTILILTILAGVSSKPHLLTTGISYATPAIITPVVAHPGITHPIVAATAVHIPLITTAAYYPAYAASYATYPAYATYPHLFRAAHFVRR